MFPKVDGQPLSPLGTHEFMPQGNFSFESYLMDLIGIPREKNNKIYDGFADLEYKKWMKVFNKAYLEGLITDDIFVDNRSTKEEKIAQGRYFALLYNAVNMSNVQSIIYKKDPKKIYISVPGPRNENLDDPKLRGPVIAGWTVTMISKKTKHPDRAIRFMSYMMSKKALKLVFLGIKGKTWDIINGKPDLLPKIRALLKTNKPAADKKYGVSYLYWMFADEATSKYEWPIPLRSPNKELLEGSKGFVVNYSAYENISPDPNTKESKMFSDLNLLKGEYIPKLITAKKGQFDKIWDEFEKARIDAGLNTVLKIETKKMLENKKKLGLL